jgi:hypothetical protein
VVRAVGEATELKLAHSPNAPNELNLCPTLVNNRQKIVPDTFFPYQKGLESPKNHLTLLPLFIYSICINVFLLYRQREELLQGNMGRGLLMIAHSLLR